MQSLPARLLLGFAAGALAHLPRLPRRLWRIKADRDRKVGELLLVKQSGNGIIFIVRHA